MEQTDAYNISRKYIAGDDVETCFFVWDCPYCSNANTEDICATGKNSMKHFATECECERCGLKVDVFVDD